MLTISPEKAFLILQKARQSGAGLEPGGPTLHELSDALKALNEDELTDLLALSQLGGGAAKTWDEAVTQARTLADAATRHLAGTSRLGDYLETGLTELGYSLDDYQRGR